MNFRLANELGISRGPLREACKTLAARGLVELIPDRGVFIRVINENEARDVYELRAGVFDYAGILLASRITDDQLSYLGSLVEQMEAAIQIGDFDRYYAPNLTFHDYLVMSTQNQRLTTTYHDLVRQLPLFRARGLVTGDGMVASNHEHRSILAALASRDPQRVFAAMASHVLEGRNRALGSFSDKKLIEACGIQLKPVVELRMCGFPLRFSANTIKRSLAWLT